MSDRDEKQLRERVWTAISNSLCPGNGGYRLLVHRDAAQAVIDDLGLTIETRGGETTTLNQSVYTWPVKSRVVGSWEVQG